MFRAIQLLVVFGICTGPSLAGVYKWTDEEGNVHFGDRPRGENAEQVKVPKSAPASQAPDAAERRQTQQRMLDIYREDREKKKQAKAEKKRKRKEMEARCVVARDRLKSFQNSVLYELQEDGERSYYSEEKKQATIKQLQAQIKKHCK